MKAITKFFVMVLVLFATSVTTLGWAKIIGLSTRVYVSQGPNNTQTENATAGVVLTGYKVDGYTHHHLVVRVSGQSLGDLYDVPGCFPGEDYLGIHTYSAKPGESQMTGYGGFSPDWWYGSAPGYPLSDTAGAGKYMTAIYQSLGLWVPEISPNIHESGGVLDCSNLIYTFEAGNLLRLSASAGGVCLIEIYDFPDSHPDLGQYDTGQIGGISTKGLNKSGSARMIVGFIIAGNEPLKVLIRGVGPGLLAYGDTAVINDPRLTLYDVNGNKLGITQGGWNTSTVQDLSTQKTSWKLSSAIETPVVNVATAQDFAKANDFALASGSADAAMTAVLAPGAYTAIVDSPSGEEGHTLVEMYSLGTLTSSSP